MLDNRPLRRVTGAILIYKAVINNQIKKHIKETKSGSNYLTR